MSELFFPAGIIDGSRRRCRTSLFRRSFFFVIFLFRFYFVDGVVTKLLVQYREPVSGRICEDGSVERRFRCSRFLLRIIGDTKMEK